MTWLTPPAITESVGARGGIVATTAAEAHATDALLALREVRTDPSESDNHVRAYMAVLDRAYVQEEDDPELLAHIRRRFDDMRDWYASRVQWRLERPQVGTIRLRRIVSLPLVSHGLKGFITAGDYEMLCLVLFYVEGLAGERFTLSGLTTSITRETRRADGTARFPWIERQHRHVLKRVVETLGSLRVVDVLDGDMDAYVAESVSPDGMTSVEALLERGPQFRLFATTLPSWLTSERVESGDPVWFERPPMDEQLLPHHRLYRALLTGPALYRDRDPGAFALLMHEDAREFVAQDLMDQFGCELELTHDYAAIVRPRGERNRGQTFPERNDLAMLVLLTAKEIRAAVADQSTMVDAGSTGRVMVPRVWFADCLQRTRANPDFALGSRVRDLGRTTLTDEAIAYLERAGVAVYDAARQLLTLLPVFARVMGEYNASATGAPSSEIDPAAGDARVSADRPADPLAS